MTQVAPTGSFPPCDRLDYRCAPDHGLVRCRVEGDGLLRQAVKELPSIGRPPAVEPESELVKIVIEMLLSHRSLVGAH